MSNSPAEVPCVGVLGGAFHSAHFSHFWRCKFIIGHAFGVWLCGNISQKCLIPNLSLPRLVITPLDRAEILLVPEAATITAPTLGRCVGALSESPKKLKTLAHADFLRRVFDRSFSSFEHQGGIARRSILQTLRAPLGDRRAFLTCQ